jgi:DNA-binding CsgD family transcriptional regulator
MFKQSLLPGFPEGAQKIGVALSILEKDNSVTYFVGGDNYFSHPIGDNQSRRFALASLMENGHVRACDLERPPLSIPHRTLMNWTAQLRKDGPASFYRAPDRAKPPVMTADKNAECAKLLADGIRPSEIARRANIKESTLRKALQRQAIPFLPESSDIEKKSPSARKQTAVALMQKRPVE